MYCFHHLRESKYQFIEMDRMNVEEENDSSATSTLSTSTLSTSIQIHIIISITQRFLHSLDVRLCNLIIVLIEKLACGIDINLLLSSLFDLAKVDWILAAGKLDIVKLDLLAAGERGRSMGFEAQIDDEVGYVLVKDFLGIVEGLRDIAMGVEEVLNCKLLDPGTTFIQLVKLTLLVGEVLLATVATDSSARFHSLGFSSTDNLALFTVDEISFVVLHTSSLGYVPANFDSTFASHFVGLSSDAWVAWWSERLRFESLWLAQSCEKQPMRIRQNLSNLGGTLFTCSSNILSNTVQPERMHAFNNDRIPHEYCHFRS
jgi:hypothetical protein